MINAPKHFALDWTRRELDETLKQARQALEAFAESDRDRTRLRACVTALHQVHGTLLMLELSGVTALSEELEQLAQALLADQVEDVDGALQILMQGILQLPVWLERIQGGGPDSRSAVLPLVNEARQARGVAPLPVPAKPAGLHGRPAAADLLQFERIDGVEKLRRIRAAYQQLLLSILRGEDRASAAASLHKVAIGLERVCAQTPMALLWRGFNLFVRGLAEHDAPLDGRIVKVLRRVDAELKSLVQAGRSGLDRPAPAELLSSLLVIARERGVRDPELDVLDEALASGEDVRGDDGPAIPGAEALKAAATAMREDVAALQDQLDMLVRADEPPLDQLKALSDPLLRLASTLSVLGLDGAELRTQADAVRQLDAADRIDESLLMGLAASLLQLDESLRGIAGDQGSQPPHAAVLTQAREGLDQIKLAVVAYVSSHWERTRLANVPSLLSGVEGALSVLGLDEATARTRDCRDYVERQLLAGVAPDWRALDNFADAISGIDYYLERLGEGSLAASHDILQLVSRSIGELNASSTGAPDANADPDAAAPELSDAVPASAADAELPAQPEDLLFADPAALGLLPPAEADRAGVTVNVAAPDSAPAVAATVVAPPSMAVDEVPAAVDGAAPVPAAIPVADAEPAPAETAPVFGDEDAELAQIFAEEAFDILSALDSSLERWRANIGNRDAVEEVRRAFHTLKGSSRLVGADLIGELAWSIENMLNRAADGTIAPSSAMLDLVTRVLPVLEALTRAFADGTAPADDVAPWIETADLVASGGNPDELPEMEQKLPPTDEDVTTPDAKAAEAFDLAPVEPVCGDLVVDGVDHEVAPADVGMNAAVDDAKDYDREVFAAEARACVAAIGTPFTTAVYPLAALDDAVARAIHTLRGITGDAGLESMHRVSMALDQIVSAIFTSGARIDEALGMCFARGARLLEDQLDIGLGGGDATTEIAEFEADAAAHAARIAAAAQGDAALLELGGAKGLLNAAAMLEAWRNGAPDSHAFADTIAALYDVRNEAESCSRLPLVLLCDALLAAYDRVEGCALEEQGCALLAEAHELLLVAFDRIAAQQTQPDVAPIVHRLDAVMPPAPPAAPEPELEAEPQPLLEAPVDGIASSLPAVTAIAPVMPEPDAAADAADVAPAFVLPVDSDAEILGLFIEEAEELLESIEQRITEWQRERDNGIHVEHLLRALHTLKGGARLAGLTELGDETHDFESYLSSAQNDGHVTASDDIFAGLEARYDVLTGWLGRIRRAAAAVPASAATAVPAQAAAAPRDDAADRARPDVQATGSAVSEAPAVAAAVHAPAPRAAPDSSAAEAHAAQEMVRVSATLLDQLVNVAGESSIVRSRIEQGIHDFAGALEEMEATIERVREQLRRLEIQTEAQVLFRSETAGPDAGEFDPLEMDRYSQLQQLSRALAESASDMLDLKETLTQRARESETLLLQQARLNTELQEGLMRTRMVPFGRLVPRLRRIVRQVAQETGKQVEFTAFNAEGELDRHVLERMVPALEHMLRNAVDHGLETPERRERAGKPAVGRIELRLTRAGADVLIEVADDGNGIDAERVRAKAIERGLLTADAALDDAAVLQFILAPGFSTAATVTQISGRGVGMDVVHTTIKQLGGSIVIHSEPGKGTRFSIRLPFTVSVNRALMVAVGDDLYAIPLNSIEGIVRLPVSELADIVAEDGGCFEYAGAPYRLRYLGQYLGRDYVARPDQAPVPVVLVRSGDLAVAVHVDAVQGSREIVVKSLGPQFAGVGGISGATILGDGSVVVILDLVALVRNQAGPVLVRSAPAEVADRPTCVMVVDDSVTVRKVTSRLLERQGMDVIVAKDGVEAMALLQEHRPDILLLDIEMPRMDGFELARHVRRDPRTAALPIVMVTSRTGSKHQDRARELGVNRFLGKPFQEAELLGTIDTLLSRRR
jgi:chemosensory pili system protein ChpA (sensor histidine kinase/response regulator)